VSIYPNNASGRVFSRVLGAANVISDLKAGEWARIGVIRVGRPNRVLRGQVVNPIFRSAPLKEAFVEKYVNDMCRIRDVRHR
jgi:hypothetical protein